MKITVLGSGNGGSAVAFDSAASGHEVSLFDFDQFPENIHAIHTAGGISSEGDLSGYQVISYAGHDIGRALQGADVIYAVGPAYSTRPFAEACKPYLKKGQIVIVCPSSCGGALEFKLGAGLGMGEDDILVAETSTLPYAVRVIAPGKLHVYLKLKGGSYLAALPASHTDFVLNIIGDVFPTMDAAENVLQTSLQNGNPIIHPAVTLLNAGLIERTQGNFLFYEEGVTNGVGRLIKSVDDERVAIGEKLGMRVLPDPELGCIQGYMTEANYDTGYINAPGFKGIGAQRSLDHRYLHEDVGYGLVFMKQLGAQLGVDTPVITSLIGIASVVMNRDYLQEAPRTPESLGLAGYSADELVKLLS
jgi:opine dehydrogenase